MAKSKKRHIQEESGQAPDLLGVVGLGASAGGLAALQDFFAALSCAGDSGLAFVVVQHLSPDCKSMLSELIQRHTSMPVCEAADQTAVRPNCVYVIPPNRDLAIGQGKLHVLEPDDPRGRRSPINFFFRALAQDQRERAIGIVLSGTGSDGALGLRAIKGEGGLALAQEPASAQYDGMPLSAIATGLVDYIQLPAEMPAQLSAYIQKVFSAGARVRAPRVSDEALRKIVLRLHSLTGHDFDQYKRENLVRRIERRMALAQIEHDHEYVRYLERYRSEGEALFHDLLIRVTRFFRDPAAFEALQQKVIAKLFADRPPGSPIRVWVPGCSTGEEAYSIAMLLQEHGDSVQQDFKAQIFATDIDGQAIEQARAGLYPASIASDLSPERLAHFFTPLQEGGPFAVRKRIREMMVFSEQNVITDPPFGKLQLISFRNVLIYLDVELHKRLFSVFHYALNSSGVLFLGSAESIGECSLFSTLDRQAKLYQRSSQSRTRLPLGKASSVFRPEDSLVPPSRQAPAKRSQTFREVTERALLQDYAAAGILVNKTGEILYLHGRTGFCLEPAPGEAGMNVFKMAREGLRRPLVAALNHVVAYSEKVVLGPLRVRSNGNFCSLAVTVRPVPAQANSSFYLIIVTNLAGAEPPQLGVAGTNGGDAPVSSTLNEELRDQREELQGAYQELETINLELQSANEEAQSVNEELQSANEELQTTQEELQSTNEELSTINSELQSKVADLSQANNDMNNLLSGTGVGTLFVDHKLRILRFTPAVTQVINLIPTDVGRPVSHIVSNMVGYDRLVEDVEGVLDTLVSRDREIQTRTGLWFMLRIRPYRTLENVIEGAVITFMEITEMKQVRQALAARELWLRQLADALPFFVWTCLGDGQCDYLGPQWLEYTGQPGLNWIDPLPDQERDRIVTAWSEAIGAGEIFSQEFPLRGKDGHYRRFCSHAVPLRDSAGLVIRWFVTSTSVES